RNLRMRGQHCFGALECSGGVAAVERNARCLDEGRQWIVHVIHVDPSHCGWVLIQLSRFARWHPSIIHMLFQLFCTFCRPVEIRACNETQFYLTIVTFPTGSTITSWAREGISAVTVAPPGQRIHTAAGDS